MYADRNTRGFNPGSMAAAVAINGALIAALIFSAPQVFAPPETPLTGYPVNADPPPPPPHPEPKPVRRTVETPRTTPRPDTPDPLVKTPVSVDPIPGNPDPGPVAPDPLPGSGGTVTVDPPTPAPVLVDASPDPRAGDFQPPYPPSEQRAGNTGRVTVRVLIGVDGRVKAVEQVAAASAAFFDATRRQALSRWRFRPATRDGVPYESWRTMTVRFELS